MCEEQQISSLSPKSKLFLMAQCTDPKCHVQSVEERVPPRGGALKHLRNPLDRPHLKSQSAGLSVIDKAVK